jgi:anthranilate/para-aminobenzoate synthase component I
MTNKMPEILPPEQPFIEKAKEGIISPVYTELPFIPAQLIYEAISSPYSFLLESIKGPEKIARYSFIGADPFLIFKVKNGNIEIKFKDRKVLSTANPLKSLKKLMSGYRVYPPKGLPPFIGGAVGMISYDFVHYLERIPRNAVDDLGLPDAHFMLIDTVIALDHKLNKTFLITCPAADEFLSGSEKKIENFVPFYKNACRKITDLYEKISSITPGIDPSDFTGNNSNKKNTARPIIIRHETEKKNYMNMVIKVKEYIRAGDIFQANISQRVSAHIGTTRPWDIYKILSRINPAPFAAFMDMGDYHIASSSPERLVRVMGDTVETRPIAGTRPRGDDDEGDRHMRAELLLDEKERAEHLMLIDLERNDLGKISDYSTVSVDELMTTEDYSHVIHIVSNIRGRIVRGKDCFDTVRAVFPGGTITGVPKVRCMEIIDELEPVARGPYTGALGYISFTGDMDLNIIIRTFVIKNLIAYVQAGAGIVADSSPEREYFETLKKAEALLRTLEII